MLKLNKLSYLFLVLLLLFTQSCTLINFDTLTVILYPCELNTVLEKNERIYAEFSIDVEKSDAENAFKCESEGVNCTGDFKWEGRRLYFIPSPLLQSSKRINIQVSGNIKTTLGIVYQVKALNAFFYNNDELPLYIKESSPEDYMSISVFKPIQIVFSKGVPFEEFKKAFSISPQTEYDIVASDENILYTIKPKTKWLFAVKYTWELKESKLIDFNESRILEDYRRSFITSEDHNLIEVSSVHSGVMKNGYPVEFLDKGLDSELENKGLVFISFTKDLDTQSVLNTIKIEPQIDSTILVVEKNKIALVLNTDFKPNTVYKIIVSKDVKDIIGTNLKSDYIEYFNPKIHPLRLTKVSFLEGTNEVAVEPTQYNIFTPLKVAYSQDYKKLAITLTFNSEISGSMAEELVEAVSVKPYFPFNIAEAALINVAWDLPNKKLSMVFQDFETSNSLVEKIYKLHIPGGASGIKSNDFSYMEADVWLLFSDK